MHLSAAVTPILDRGREHFQDVSTWIAEGLIDTVFPMNYAATRERFVERLQPWTSMDVRVVMGVRAGIGGSAEERLEIALERADGFALFAYSSLFDSTNVQIDAQDAQTRAARRERRERLVPFLRERK